MLQPYLVSNPHLYTPSSLWLRCLRITTGTKEMTQHCLIHCTPHLFGLGRDPMFLTMVIALEVEGFPSERSLLRHTEGLGAAPKR